ncbi:MAG: beta-N-acetylhexosaminidase [Lachnospiraceae bacterium]|nr:beta-N-acetylhexosaminidase [Lachnospiraceae bacterium]
MDGNRDTERRIFRHKRRVRNQIIAYISLGVIIAALVVGGIFAAKYITKLIKDKKSGESAEDASIESAENEEPLTISDPEPVPETETEEVDWLDEMVNACIAEMPLEDKVAGLFVITPEELTGVGTAVKAGDGTKEALGKYAVGGLVYFSKNIQSEAQLTEMLANTVLFSKYPLFLAVDEEGGKVSRVADSSIAVDKVGTMAEIGAGGDAQNAYEAGTTIGAYLKRLGFNLDFAPVADVLTNPDNKTIGDRSFGTDGALAAQMVPSFVTGLEEEGVSSCLKHFPGLGDTTEDTHDGMAVTERTLEEFQTVEFPVFKAGIDAGADFVMVSHVSVPSLTGDNTPASLSGAVVGILRNDLGFNGIVITDALNMTAVTDYYTADEAAIKAIQSGADMLLMPESFETAYEGLLQAVQNGTISEERINESLRRIYRVKYADRME